MAPLDQSPQLSARDRQIVTDCKRLIRQLDPAATVVLFGSTARGAREAGSDYNIIVLSQRVLSAEERDRMDEALLDLELDLGVVVSSLLFTRDQWNRPLHRASPFHREMEREGVVV